MRGRDVPRRTQLVLPGTSVSVASVTGGCSAAMEHVPIAQVLRQLESAAQQLLLLVDAVGREHTTRELLERWWQDHEHDWKGNTRAAYATRRDVLLEHLGDIPCRELTVRHAMSLIEGPGKPVLRGFAYNMLRQASAHGRLVGWFDRDPLAGMPKFRAPLGERGFEIFEVRALWQAFERRKATARPHAAVAIACAQSLVLSGMSQADGRAMRRSQLDRVRFQARLGPRKGALMRTVPVSQAYLDLLDTVPGDGDIVFAGRRSACIGKDSLRREWGRACEAIGLPQATPHWARHTVATWMAEARDQLNDAQRVLGHKHESSTRIYIHPSRDRLRRRLDEFARLVMMPDNEVAYGEG